MEKWIDAEAAVDAVKRSEALVRAFGFHNAIEAIREVPAADVAPVRRGRWETKDGWDGDEYYACSSCGAEFVLIDGTPSDNDYNYCPHCGAKMDGGE